MLHIDGETYYSTMEVCDMFGVSRNTWDRWRRLYNVKHAAIGHRRFFPNTELKRLMERTEAYGITPRRKEAGK